MPLMSRQSEACRKADFEQQASKPVAWAPQCIVTVKQMRKDEGTAPPPSPKGARQKSLNPIECRDGSKTLAASYARDRPFFRQPLGLIFLWPAQAGYGDKWPSE
jgi:hypothetical protein